MSGVVLDAADLPGRRTMIVGEVNSGKTTLTRRLLADWLDREPGLGGRAAVVDLAPVVPAELARQRGLTGVGGRLIPPEGSGVLHLFDHLVPPRLSARDEAEAVRLAGENLRLAEALLDRLDSSGRQVVFINDLSLYLQAGAAARLASRLAAYPTVVANAYRGARLGGGELSRRERAELEEALAWFHRVVEL